MLSHHLDISMSGYCHNWDEWSTRDVPEKLECGWQDWSDALGMGFCLQVMAVVACTHLTCKSNCHEYGIFFAPSVCQRCCGSRMDGHSCIRTKVLAEDVASVGTVQMFKLTLPRGWKDIRKNTQINKKKCGKSDIGLIECKDQIKRVSYLLYLDETKTRGGKKTRLCAGNTTLLKQHLCLIVMCVHRTSNTNNHLTINWIDLLSW